MPEAVPYQLMVGNVVTTAWVDWRGRTQYTNGIISDVVNGAVVIAESSEATATSRSIDHTRFRLVSVAAEGDAAKAARLMAAAHLMRLARALKASEVAPGDLVTELTTLAESFTVA